MKVERKNTSIITFEVFNPSHSHKSKVSKLASYDQEFEEELDEEEIEEQDSFIDE